MLPPVTPIGSNPILNAPIVPDVNNIRLAPSLLTDKILDYVVTGDKLQDADGSLTATVINTFGVAGPGSTPMGKLPQALDFSRNGKASVSIPQTSLALISPNFFSLRLCFQVTKAVQARQNLFETDFLPVSVFLDKPSNATSSFKLVANVGTKAYGWAGVSTDSDGLLLPNIWYTVDVVMGANTLTVAINGVPSGVRVFPVADMLALPGNQVFIGTWVDGARNPFFGKIAGLQLYKGVMPALAASFEHRFADSEWPTAHKYQAIGATVLGTPTNTSDWSDDAQAFVQPFTGGLIQYSEVLGVPFEMHGSIWAYYKKLPASTAWADLGWLVSDELATAGGKGRKSLFQKGGIYWSPGTGAVHVTGRMYLDYETLGESSSFLGFPKAAATGLKNGVEQVFEGGRMYYKTDAGRSFEVHGAILARFLQLGGQDWLGFPVSNELDVIKDGVVLGKQSQFEGGIVYWSAATGAYEVQWGEMLDKYKAGGGPLGPLGFPTSGLTNLPSNKAVWYYTFQKGSIVSVAGNGVFVCQPFTLFVGRIDTVEDEGAGQGQNDLIVRITLSNNGVEIFNQRYPDSGDMGDDNIQELNLHLPPVIMPNDPKQAITLTVEAWDSDKGAPFGGGDDHLGFYSHTLSIADAWGMANKQGVFDSGSFDKINSIAWAVQPVVKDTTLTPNQLWWGVRNTGLSPVTYAQYAAAFSNVDSDPEIQDIGDWMDKAFYAAIIEDIAANGRCAGMCIEAILAYKHNSNFSLPLNRFRDREVTSNEFSIKHERQVGEPAVWWFAGQFLTGNTHAPVSVFNETRTAHMQGCHPILCIAQNYDFSGAPHVLLPKGWVVNGTQLQLQVYDPNYPADDKGNDPTRTVFIDSATNTFSYDGGNKYSGGQWSGGRLYYMPWPVLAGRPRTPVWEAALLLLQGLMIVMGNDTSTVSLTDTQGNPLDITHPDVTARLKAGQKDAAKNRFFAYKGFDGSDAGNPLGAGLLLRRGLDSGPKQTAGSAPGIVPNADFVHRVRSNKAGSVLQYAVKSMLKEVRISGALDASEDVLISVADVHRPTHNVTINSAKARKIDLEIVHHLNVQGDHVRYAFSQLPLEANADLKIGLQPGLSALDLLLSGKVNKLNLKITSSLGGKAEEHTYSVVGRSNLRIRQLPAAGQKSLLIGSIEKLGSPATDFMLRNAL